MKLVDAEFNLYDIAEHVVSLYSTMAAKKGVILTLEMPPLSNLVHGDAQRLRQVLNNLISNAVKFTDQGEIILSIEILDSNTKQYRLLFTVKDTGIGISEKNQSILFDKFVQVDASTTRKYGGTGLGLAIVQKFIQMMNSEICVHSQTGVGSRFYFELILKKASQFLEDTEETKQERKTQQKMVINNLNTPL